MTAHLYIAPAAHGKTAYAVDLARRSTRLPDGRLGIVRVVVATGLQVRAFRRRLAGTGGALGVRVMTFDRLYAECLAEAGATYTELSEPVLYRLVTALIAGSPLSFYDRLRGFPGFTQAVLDLFGELKANRIEPTTLREAVTRTGGGPRLVELADLYAAYQARLHERQWVDRAGLGWLALDALTVTRGSAATKWPLVIFDGFDDFSEIQLGVVRSLTEQAGEVIVTLTGVAGAFAPRAGNAHRRFERTRDRLEQALCVAAEPLPHLGTRHVPPLAALETCLYLPCDHAHDAEGCIDLIAATDRAGEVRAALRWLKERIAVDGMSPADVALFARSITPYRTFIEQTGSEFGLPIRLATGSPLGANPAIAALLALLALAAPAGDGSGPVLPRRGVIDAWRCPYFDLAAALPGSVVAEGDAEALDSLARWGRVAGGRGQWDELFDRVAKAASEGDPGEDDRGPTMPLPREAALILRDRFTAFVAAITPPVGASTCRAFASWLEDLIGTEGRQAEEEDESRPSLRLAACAGAVPETASRDLLALNTLKQTLLGLVWAEEAIQPGPVDFAGFLTALVTAVAGASVIPPVATSRAEILAADVVQGRGLAFRAVALLGMAEGEFPGVIGEDHFVRDDDRTALERHNVRLRPSTESNEAEYFYEAVCRARERLLLTRPRIADNGATWLPSPYWEEVRRLAHLKPRELAGSAAPAPGQAASWPELLVALAQHGADPVLRDWVRAAPIGALHSWQDVAVAAEVVSSRSRKHRQATCDGWLAPVARDCAARFGPDKHWSASALETYRTCPFSFYVGRVLGLSPRQDPAEDLDDRQRGNIFHRILERTYRETEDRTDPAALLATLARVAPKVLDEAPEREGFRATRWWLQTRAEMQALAAAAVEKLAALQGPYVPAYFERKFAGRILGAGGFNLAGTIDRIDIAPGGAFRIVDYKSGGASTYVMPALLQGKKLQLGLYAQAGQDVLGLGEPASGFYFHIATGEASKLKLEEAPGGVDGAIDTAVGFAMEAISGVRAGNFVPHPPTEGCPPFCSGAAFCWHYTERFRAQ